MQCSLSRTSLQVPNYIQLNFVDIDEIICYHCYLSIQFESGFGFFFVEMIEIGCKFYIHICNAHYIM